MRVRVTHDLVQRGFQFARHADLRHELAHVVADHVDAQQFAVLGVRHDLHETVRGFGGQRASVRPERVLAGDDLVARLLRLRHGHADRGDFGVAVPDGGDVPVRHGVFGHARDMLGGDDALVRSDVRQHRLPGHIPDRVDARLVRPAPAVDPDEAILHRDPVLLEAEILGHGPPSDGHEHEIRLLGGLAAVGVHDREDHRARVAVQVLDVGVREVADPPLPERALERLPDLGVLEGHERVERLDQRDVDSEGVEDVGELDADESRSDDRHLRGELLEAQRLPAADHLLAVEFEAGEGVHHGAGREDDVSRRDLPGLAVRLDRDAARARQPAAALHDVDLVLPEQVLHAGRELPRDDAASLHRRGEVVLHFDRLHAHAGAVVLEVVRERGALEQRLGGDAAPVEAGAAEAALVRPALDAGGPEAELRGPDRTHVAGRSGPDHDHVVSLRHLSLHSLCCWRVTAAHDR